MGVREEAGSRGSGYMYTDNWFVLYSRNQPDIVKQLYSNWGKKVFSIVTLSYASLPQVFFLTTLPSACLSWELQPRGESHSYHQAGSSSNPKDAWLEFLSLLDVSGAEEMAPGMWARHLQIRPAFCMSLFSRSLLSPPPTPISNFRRQPVSYV